MQPTFLWLGRALSLVASANCGCWGANDYGQLGDGTTKSRLLPTPVKGLCH
jgi:hypothetical protein